MRIAIATLVGTFCLLAQPAMAQATAPAAQTPSQARNLRVFLDCSDCFQDFLQSEVVFVDYVRDRTEADVHVLVTSSPTGSGGLEYTMTFTGLGDAQGVNHTLRAVTTSSDSEDIVRRQLVTTLGLGLLTYITREGVSPLLSLRVTVGSEKSLPAVASDRWDSWVFSLGGSASVDAEESSRQIELGAQVGADRITPDWKITVGAEFDHERERFDIGEEDSFEVQRRELDVNGLVVKGLGEHWSIGARGELGSSTFENTQLAVSGAPAIEFNVFPYSAYTRRQLRVLYSLGARTSRYYDETLFGLTGETRGLHELSVTFDLTERWGSLRARTEWSQYLHDLALSRLEVEGELAWRVARGFRVVAEVGASRIRDQISLPRRGATPEEILLRLREIRSGYEYQVSFGMTYSFGSIFSSIVNPRFGQ